MKVFFYGLFMDQELLRKLGVAPSNAVAGFVEGFELCIGERATLQRRPGAKSHGVVMDLDNAEATSLYSEGSVADYVPEIVNVELANGGSVEATCYNLPAEKVTGANEDYARSLFEVASKLGMPKTCLNQISTYFKS